MSYRVLINGFFNYDELLMNSLKAAFVDEDAGIAQLV